MASKHLLQRFGLLSVALLLQTAVLPSFAPEAQATPKTQNSFSLARKRQVVFVPKGSPDRTTGGGRRDNGVCPQDESASKSAVVKTLDQRLAPIVPAYEAEAKKPGTNWGLTVSANPTYLVYVPKTSAKTAEFTLRLQETNKRQKDLYSVKVALPQTPGIVSIQLPSNAPALEVGKVYVWGLQLACTANVPDPNDPSVQGVIRRVEPDASLKGTAGKPRSLDQVELYAKAGIWYDTVAELAMLRNAKPNDAELDSVWKGLLEPAGLGPITSVPLKPIASFRAK